MNHFILSSVLASLFSSIASIRAFSHWNRGKIYRLYGIYWFSIAFWTFTVAFQFQLLESISDFLWGWFLHLGCTFIPVLFFHFVVVFTKQNGYGKYLRAAYWVTVLFNILNAVTPFFTEGISRREFYAYPTPSTIYPGYVILFFILVVWGIKLLWSFRKSVESGEKFYLGFVVSTMAGYVGGMDNFLIMWDIHIYPLYPYGLYLVVVYAMMSAQFLSQTELFKEP